jgi:hypothetical protein
MLRFLGMLVMIIGVLFSISIAVVIIQNIPDIQRYLKMRSM